MSVRVSTPVGPIALAPPDELFRLDTNVWTAPYWEAARERRLIAPRCSECTRFRMPPQPFCPHCHSQKLTWKTLSGVGIVYSFTIVGVAIVPAMQGHVPYVPAVVSLPDAEDIRIISNIVDSPVNIIAIGAELNVCWHERADGVVVPHFRLSARAATP